MSKVLLFWRFYSIKVKALCLKLCFVIGSVLNQLLQVSWRYGNKLLWWRAVICRGLIALCSEEAPCILYSVIFHFRP